MKSSKRKQNKGFLPTGSITWTQIETVERSEREYIEHYVYGKKRPDTIYLELGRMVAETLERRGEQTNVAARAIRILVPHYPKTDVNIETTLTRGKEKLKIWGKLDGWNPRKNLQGEYKTGTYPWSKKRAQDHGQLKLYALIHYKNTGKIPDQELTWIETKFENGDLGITGNFLTHQVRQTLKDLLEMEARIWKAKKKIELLTKKELDII